MSGLPEAKAAARRDAMAIRGQAHALGQGAAADHLSRLLAPYGDKVLAGYAAMRSEIDPQAVLLAHPGPVCLPVIAGKGQALGFRAWDKKSALVAGTFGAQIPEQGPWLVPDLLIVPLLAYDPRGYRLGYGGGFYDRTLEALRREKPVLAIGFAYSAQARTEVPTETTDQKLDAIVTEEGSLMLRPEAFAAFSAAFAPPAAERP